MKKILFACVITITCGLIVFIGLSIRQSQSVAPLFYQPGQAQSTQSVYSSLDSELIVYGYLPYWTKSKAVYTPTITHVSYFSLGIQPDGSLLNIPKKNQETGYRSYQNGVLSQLRETIRSKQKLELTLTMMDQEAIPMFLKNTTAQDTFIRDLKIITTTQPISGINIDIEYNGIVDDTLQKNLTTLLHRANTVLKSNSPPQTLSIATYSDAGNLQRLTNIQTIAPEVDLIIVMAYDFHRSKSPNAGPNAPIYGKTSGKWAEDIMSDLKEYTQYVPSNKILLGIPFYGYAWSVEDSSNPNSFSLPKSGESVPYSNILNLLTLPSVQREWDSEALSPYLRYSVGKTAKILYYDDPQSLTYKLRLVRQAQLGGIAIWALGYDEGNKKLWDTIQQNISK